MAFSLKNLEKLVKLAIDNNASDIHLRSNESPVFRIYGQLTPVQTQKFSRENLIEALKLLNPELENLVSPNKQQDQNILEEDYSFGEIEGAYSLGDLCRLRYNFYQYLDELGIVLRVIKKSIPSIEELKLPPIISDLSLKKRGLILVTGATGSGKSTTLAAMINHINENSHSHIITLEDPVEFIHPQINSRISQREIGINTASYQTAMKNALRQDPDVILVGEIRDSYSLSTALKAAETGHLILATLHTTDVLSTIGRVLSMFSPNEQDEIRKRLASSLCAIISQRMLKKASQGDVIPALEILINSQGTKECILGEEPLSRLVDIMRKNYGEGGNGSQSFDQHIMKLYTKKIISKETALLSASNQSDFIQQLMMD